MRGSAASFEKTGLCQNGDAGADAGNERALGMKVAQPGNCRRILLDHDVDVGASGRDQHEVGALDRGQRKVGNDAHASAAEHRQAIDRYRRILKRGSGAALTHRFHRVPAA